MSTFDFEDEERREQLEAVREEQGKLGRTEQGKQYRTVAMCLACMAIVWVVLFLFDFVNGRGIAATTAVVAAAFTGVCWSYYRETREREFGLYALVAVVVCVALVVVHFLGIA
ncbi:MAG: DUF6442 family protein [Coriobacteriia bacterium]|nr:DUF6442 family protein [Coriobacteriia bacterium]